jgi:hypothetical protein
MDDITRERRLQIVERIMAGRPREEPAEPRPAATVLPFTPRAVKSGQDSGPAAAGGIQAKSAEPSKP